MTISHMHIACWLLVSTNTHTIHVAFPLQQWSHEISAMLRYTYIAELVFRYRQQGADLQRLPLNLLAPE